MNLAWLRACIHTLLVLGELACPTRTPAFAEGGTSALLRNSGVHVVVALKCDLVLSSLKP